MQNRVFVSGFGIISALGINAKSNLANLLQENTGIQKAQFLQTNHREIFVGEVKYNNSQLADLAQINTSIQQSRTSLLGLIAASEAIRHARLNKEQTKNSALISSTSVGGMDLSELAYGDLMREKPLNFNAAFGQHLCGKSTKFISKQLEIQGYTSTISTACSSSANAIMLGGRLIKSGDLDSVIAGGTDALSLFTLNGFDSLKILDPEWCRPFDKNRRGLNLGEGAAYLVLESEDSLKRRNGLALAELMGFGNSNDAYHQTASSPEGKGALSAMQKAMNTAKMSPNEIDYINAHGTGTENNDASESMAIKALFGSDHPPFSTTKAFTGHTLAAAGAIEAVISILSIQEQCVFPSLNIAEPMDLIASPITKIRKAQVKTVLSNSFGFGGNCSSLIFQGS